MTSKFRPILPAYSGVDEDVQKDGNDRKLYHPTDLAIPKAKRTPVYTACNHCRKRKIRCDGQTPACARCVTRKLNCEYDIEPDVSRQVSMKRKFEVMREEASSLRELYQYLHDRPENEAIAILHRIRATTDPTQVLRIIKEGDMLIQGLISDNSHDDLDPRAKRLADEALLASPLKLCAHSWTGVAPDGIVSELVSSFFIWNQTFYLCFIDKDLFLKDMSVDRSPKAIWCSPLLVNSICAFQCFTSNRAKRFGLIQGKDLGQVFQAEARKLFDQECGKASIPTIQALLILFMISAVLGRDRAGVLYRYTAYELLRRLRLDLWYHKLDSVRTDSSVQEQMGISRVVWGIFCFESTVSFAYLQPPLVQRPIIPKIFVSNRTEIGCNEDINGKPSGDDLKSPASIVGILYPMCELSEITHEVMSLYDSQREVGDAIHDLEKRWALYRKVQAWKAALPNYFRSEDNFTPQTYYLRTVENLVIIGIFRPLDQNTSLPEKGLTAGQLCNVACHSDVKGLALYEEKYGFDDYSVMAVYPMYNASLTLVSKLQDPSVTETFTNACRIIHDRLSDFPFTTYLLQTLWTLARQLQQTLPPGSLKYFKPIKDQIAETTGDIPISFALPFSRELYTVLNIDKEEGVDDESRTHMGSLLSKYAEISLN